MILPDGAENLETPSRYIAAGVDEYAEEKAVTIERCPASLFTSFLPREQAEIRTTLRISGIIVEAVHIRVSPHLAAAVREMNLLNLCASSSIPPLLGIPFCHIN